MKKQRITSLLRFDYSLLGQLYLGDPDENGGSAENPLVTHLHFAIRAGQRTDYTGMGEWRWQAGWIKLCPQDVGWLNSSEIITGQEIPSGGFTLPGGNFFSKWGVELVFISIYVIGAVCMLIYAIRKNKPINLAIYGGILIVAGFILSNKGTRISLVLYPLAALILCFAIFQYILQAKRSPETNHSN